MIQALSKLDPMQHYYVNDQYIYSISNRDNFKLYSPKALISGYWKKDYKQFISLNQSNEEEEKLPKINIKNYKFSFTKIENSTLNEKQSEQLTKIKLLDCQKNKLKDQGKTMSKLNKRASKDQNNQSVKIIKNIRDDDIVLEKVAMKKDILLNLLKQSQTPQHQSKNVLFKTSYIPIDICKQSNNQSLINPQINISNQYNIQHKLTLNKLYSHIIKKQDIRRVIVIQFDNVLSYQEKCFYGLQLEYLQSEQYQKYNQIKEHYFFKLSPHSEIFILKNISDLFQHLSSNFYIILLIKHASVELINYIKLHNLPINIIYEIEQRGDFTELISINFDQIFEDLKIINLTEYIFVSSYENQTQEILQTKDILQYIQLPVSRKNIEQKMLLFPNISMSNIQKCQLNSSKLFLHIPYYIQLLTDQLIQGQQGISQFNENMRLKLINLQEYLQEKKQKLSIIFNQIKKMNQLKLFQRMPLTQKEILNKLVQQFEAKYETSIQELVLKNKRVLKTITKCQLIEPQEENLNKLEQEINLIDICLNLKQCYVFLI